MDHTDMKIDNSKLIRHKGFNLISGIHDPDEVDQIYDLELRDSDVFSVTYPKSGTIWMQQILMLIEAKGDMTVNKHRMNGNAVPWIEARGKVKEFATELSPRVRTTHLQHRFMPLALRQKKGKVIYVTRNPKDVLVSYFYFHKVATMLETPKDFNDFFEKFMKGDVHGGSWFEHIKTWYSQKDNMNIFFITYEEMIQDLHSAVERIAAFLGKDLTQEQSANVVKHSTFKNMKQIPEANYEYISSDLLDHQQGSFMRKGTIGDWKNHFTVAQNERFDKLFQDEMKDFPVQFIWEVCDIV
ncbi:amine sulfotransferase-like [Lampris incognitus]|uniref:amine sulfotransferase-like n=1 Tax=Lampris incognitus TaxID=2546036 RepID=UPI0024B489C7|nr:amine sulfotransferase-like [Lampris incognitus]